MEVYKEIINLIAVTQGKDSDGYPVETEHPHEAFANKKSVTRDEFYKSYAAGINATAVFVTRTVDFEESAVTDSDAVKHDATRLEWDGRKYNIIRTYQPDEDSIELVCSDLGV